MWLIINLSERHVQMTLTASSMSIETLARVAKIRATLSCNTTPATMSTITQKGWCRLSRTSFQISTLTSLLTQGETGTQTREPTARLGAIRETCVLADRRRLSQWTPASLTPTFGSSHQATRTGAVNSSRAPTILSQPTANAPDSIRLVPPSTRLALVLMSHTRRRRVLGLNTKFKCLLVRLRLSSSTHRPRSLRRRRHTIQRTRQRDHQALVTVQLETQTGHRLGGPCLLVKSQCPHTPL